MRNIFIIHGSNGYPEENWFPWLKSELEKDSVIEVTVPQFQIPEEPILGGHHYSEWKAKLLEYKDKINKDTIFVTHSRGCIFIMHALVDLGIQEIYGLFLVAPWIQYRWYESAEDQVDSFHFNPINWSTLKKIAKHIVIFQSTNDVIPVEEGEGIATMLKASLELVENAGHLNASAGYTTFPLLLSKISELID